MADFNIVIKVQSGGAVASTKNVEKGLKRVEDRANSAQKAMKRVFAGVAAGQGAVQSIRFLANFSQEMSTVKAISGATEKQFESMRKAAIDLGTTTRFTATQAASGMLFLARSGFDTAEILETIPGVLNLAQAGALDLGRAADITTNVLKGFGLETSETSRVVDVLALAANSANTTVEQLGQAMKFVAPIAAGVNMSLEDTAAAMQVLSNAGLQASMAGTGLRRVIGALEGPTTAQEKVLNSLGLTTEDVKVSQVGLAAALDAITSKTNDAGIMLRLFGQRGGPASIVMGKLTEEIKNFGSANLAASGTAQNIAKIMDDNLNGAILRVKSAFQGLLILFGDVSAVSGLRTFLEGLAMTLRFLAKNARGLNDALGVLVIGFLAYRAALVKVAIVQVQWGKLMTMAVGPQMIIALTAIIALLVLFKDELTVGGEGLVTFGHIGEVVAERLNGAFAFLVESMGGHSIEMEGGWRKAFSNVATMGLAMVQTLAQGFDKIVGFFVGLWNSAKVVTEMVQQTFDEAWVNIANGAQKWIQTAIKFWVDKLNAFADKLHLGDKFKIDPVAFTDPLEKIPDSVILTGEDVGKAFMDGLSRSGLEDAFLDILTDAENKAISQITLDPAAEPGKPKVPDVPTEIFGPDLPTGGRRGGKTWAQLMEEIKQETELLKLNSREMEIQQGLLSMQDELGRKLIPIEQMLAKTALEKLQAQRDVAAAYDEIRGPMEDLAAKQVAINTLFREGKISADEFAVALNGINIQQGELGTSMSSGLQAGLGKIKASIMDVSGAAERTLVNAFSGAEDALANFVTTGELNFSGFVDGILQNLTRLLMKQALLSMFGGPAGMLAGALGGGGGVNAATGGQFIVGGSGGTDSQRIPMNMTPGERVTVETPKQQRDNDAPSGGSPNITIVNVTDPDEVANAMASGEGERVILNVIAKNRNTVRNNLA